MLAQQRVSIRPHDVRCTIAVLITKAGETASKGNLSSSRDPLLRRKVVASFARCPHRRRRRQSSPSSTPLRSAAAGRSASVWQRAVPSAIRPLISTSSSRCRNSTATGRCSIGTEEDTRRMCAAMRPQRCGSNPPTMRSTFRHGRELTGSTISGRRSAPLPSPERQLGMT